MAAYPGMLRARTREGLRVWGEGIEPVDEIEDVAVGDTQAVAVNLDAGSYVPMCNIYDKAKKEWHHQQGMHTAFTVT